MDNIVTIKGLKKHFPVKSTSLFGKKRLNRAVDDIDLSIERGEALGIVGESGSGKTTLGKLILGLHTPTEGVVEYAEERDGGSSDSGTAGSLGASGSSGAAGRPNFSVVFQDPFSSLNPRMTVFNIVKEPLEQLAGAKRGADYRRKILETLNMVGLSEEQMFRYPHEFSGGQRQRIAIARAVVSKPLFIVFDEPTSGLDVSVQAQILNLLKEMKIKFDLSYIFISHNLGVIKYICQRIVVMYSGKIMEIADNQELFDNPRHPYTQKLLAAVPVIDDFQKTKILDETKREIPTEFTDSVKGCIYYAKCSIRKDICAEKSPEKSVLGGNHTVYCWMHEESVGN
jgi:peptide/nickel transport system ATP-binding protein